MMNYTHIHTHTQVYARLSQRLPTQYRKHKPDPSINSATTVVVPVLHIIYYHNELAQQQKHAIKRGGIQGGDTKMCLKHRRLQ